MSLFIQVLESLIYKLPLVFGVISELNTQHSDTNTDAEVVLAQSSYYTDPLYVKGMVIMFLLSCIILVCIKISRIDLAYVKSNR